VILRGLQGLALVAVAALLGLLIWRVAHQSAGAKLVDEIKAGKKPAAPDFVLKPLWTESTGASPRLAAAVRRGSVAVEDLRGRPTIVNIFASWCVPCRDEAPLFSAAAVRYAGRVQFVALDFHDFAGDGRSFLRRYGNDFAALHDGDGHVAERWGATGVPETYVLDAQGRLIAHAPGAVGRDDLRQLVSRALAS